MGDDPLDMASSTGRSCGTVGMETGMTDFVTCPISAGGRQQTSITINKSRYFHSTGNQNSKFLYLNMTAFMFFMFKMNMYFMEQGCQTCGPGTGS